MTLRRLADRFEDNVAAALMAAVLAVLGVQVVSRYVLGDPLSWTEEVARHLFIWMVFFGASGAIRDRSHVAITLAVERLPTGLRVAVSVVVDLLVLFFLANLLYWGVLAVGRMWYLPTATLELPVGLVYAVLPISAGLMILRIVARLIGVLRAPGVVPVDAMPRGLD